MSYRDWEPKATPAAGGFWHLPFDRQIGYGCLGVIFIATAMLYCVGTLSLIVRPAFQRTPTITPTTRPTQTMTATLGPPTLINLPRGTLLATPTQAPIPTRETPTLTPTVDLTNPAPVITGTVTVTATLRVTPTLTINSRSTSTPTRRITTTPIPR